jgi:hypothetical protein
LNFNVVGDENEGDTVNPSFLDNSVAFKLISATKAYGNNLIYMYLYIHYRA